MTTPLLTFEITNVRLSFKVDVMNGNIIAICITAIISFGGISLAIYFGLQGSTNKITDKLTNIKESITEQLQGINEKIVKIETTGDNIWELVKEHLTRPTGTVERQLKNFGNVKISAEPGEKSTSYTIRIEKGNISTGFISIISKKTGFENYEKEIFNELPSVTVLSPVSFKLVVPSLEPKKCMEYISKFLKWLDTEYVQNLQTLKNEYEDDIEV